MTEACYGRPAGGPETELQEDTVQLNRENLITVIETGKSRTRAQGRVLPSAVFKWKMPPLLPRRENLSM